MGTIIFITTRMVMSLVLAGFGIDTVFLMTTELTTITKYCSFKIRFVGHY